MAQAVDGGVCRLAFSGMAGGSSRHPSCAEEFSPFSPNQVPSVPSPTKDRAQPPNFAHSSSPRASAHPPSGMNQFHGPPPGLGGGGGRGAIPGACSGATRKADFANCNVGNNNTPRQNNSLSVSSPPPGLGISPPGPGLDFLAALAGRGGMMPPKPAGQGGIPGMPVPRMLPPPFPGMFPPAFPPLPFPMPPNFAAVAAATALMRCGTAATQAGADLSVGAQRRLQPNGSLSPATFRAVALQGGAQSGKGSQQGGVSRTPQQTLKDVLQANGEKDKLKKLVKEELRKEGYNFVLLNLATEKIKQKGGPEGLDEETMLELMRNEGREKIPVAVKKLLVTLIEGLAGKDKKKEKDEEREKEAAAAAAAAAAEAEADRRHQVKEKKEASRTEGKETALIQRARSCHSESSACSGRSRSRTERGNHYGRPPRGRSVSKSTSRSSASSRDHVRSISHSHSPVGTLGRPLPEHRGNGGSRTRRSGSRSRERNDSGASRSYSRSSRGGSRSTSQCRSSSGRSRRHTQAKRPEEEGDEKKMRQKEEDQRKLKEGQRKRWEGEGEGARKEADRKRKRKDGDDEKGEKKVKSRESEKKSHTTTEESRRHPGKHTERNQKSEDVKAGSDKKDKPTVQKSSGEKVGEPTVAGKSPHTKDKARERNRSTGLDNGKRTCREKSRKSSTRSGQSNAKRK